MTLEPRSLLEGPRGRRLCYELAMRAASNDPAGDELGSAAFSAAYDLDPAQGTTALVLFGPGADVEPPHPTAAEVAALLDALPMPEPSRRELLDALVATADSARYWQEPDGADALAATPEMRTALIRVADAIVQSPHSAWWVTPVDRPGQCTTTFEWVGRPTEGSAADRLARWRTQLAEEEAAARRERPTDPHANWSGSWWATPPRALLHTTRRLQEFGPAGLWLVEDGFGWEHATVSALRAPGDATVYEIDGPAAWAELCGRYPVEVPASRRHDWFRTTGENLSWVLPDWLRVAGDFDGVHLTVAGYLSTAGRATPAGDGSAGVLAGWNPDETYWLHDIPRTEAPTESWAKRDDTWAATKVDSRP